MNQRAKRGGGGEGKVEEERVEGCEMGKEEASDRTGDP